MSEATPGVREYVKINGVWQHTDVAWYVDRKRIQSVPPPQFPQQLPGVVIQYNGIYYKDWECVAHIHHWKTKLEEYDGVLEDWKCIRCGDEVPASIQSMIKLYRPLKDI